MLIAPATTLAQNQTGGVIVRVPDSASSRCINGKTDVIWLTLRRVVTNRSESWFTKDRSVALLVNALVRTYPQAPKAISFPLITDTTLRGYAIGQVSLPIEYTIVDTLPLKEGSYRYSGLEIDLTLLNKQSANGWGRALQALADVSKKLPIPSNPITQSATYLLDFTNAAITKDLEAQNADDKAKSAVLALNFDPTGRCAGVQDFERTGTIAVLQSAGVIGPNLIPIDQTDQYCWTADLQPDFILKAAPKGSTSCDDQNTARDYVQVTNNYSAFVLSALPSGKVLGATSIEDRKNALRRCEANGLPSSACIGVPE